jgi:pilus assembly protein Flp/PilA
MIFAYLRHFLTKRFDNRAVTTIEYGLIAALVAVVIITGLTSLGKGVSTTFTKISAEL